VEVQKTIANPVKVEGTGLFSGESSQVTLKPAEPDTGIVFVRVDLPKPVRIPARMSSLSPRSRRTTLHNGTVSIETVEHCLAAVGGLAIDNLEIEISGGELPNVDGSCEPYVQALMEAGTVEQDELCKTFVIEEPVAAEEGDAKLCALPGRADELSIFYDLDYSEIPAIGRQMFNFRASPEAFIQEVSSARTFLTETEAHEFQKRGIGSHLTYKDILVLGADGPIENALRFKDECARHKVVDLLGDIVLLGRHLRGRLVAYRSGHSCNHQMVKKLLESVEKQKRSRQTNLESVLDIRKIQKVLPHRYPLLLVDRVVEIDGDRRAVGIKNVTMNEPFFQGHFPGIPIMPGVLIVEAMAQMSGLLFAQRLEHTGQLAVLLSMDKVKMRRAVVPGDQLILEVETVRVKSRTGDCRCRALVGNQVAAEAQIRFMLVDADPV